MQQKILAYDHVEIRCKNWRCCQNKQEQAGVWEILHIQLDYKIITYVNKTTPLLEDLRHQEIIGGF